MAKDSVGRSIGIVGLANLVGTILGVGVQAAIAYQFGASHLTDAFFMARDISELLTKWFLGGQIGLLFLPAFVGHLDAGDPDRAWEFFSLLFNLMLVVGLLLSVLMVISAKQLTELLAPGFSAQDRGVTASMLQWMLVAGLPALMSGLLISVFHAHSSFRTPAVSMLVSPCVFLVTMATAVPFLGIWSLVAASVVANTTQFMLLWLGAVHLGMTWRMRLAVADEDIRRFGRLLLPFLVSSLAVEGSGAVLKIMVSHFPAGTVSALNYANRLVRATHSVLSMPMNIVVFPRLALSAARGRLEEIATTIRRGISMFAFFLLPVSFVAVFARRELVDIVLRRGAFRAFESGLTADLFGLAMSGLFLVACYILFYRTCFALGAIRVVVVISVITEGLQALLYVVLGGRFGVRGLVVSSLLASLFVCVTYSLTLRRRLHPVGRFFVTQAMMRIGVILMISVLLVEALGAFGQTVLPRELPSLTGPALSVLFGLILYLFLAEKAKLEEWRILREALPFRKWGPAWMRSAMGG